MSIRSALLTVGFALVATAAAAQDPIVKDYDGSFDDALFAVESAILGRGLVIDYVSHVGDMLNRTAADVGSDVVIFDEAQIFLFCSAVASRAAMEADPMNLQHCPYGIFVAERDGKVMIGRRAYPAGSMEPVEALLDGIVAEAVEGL